MNQFSPIGDSRCRRLSSFSTLFCALLLLLLSPSLIAQDNIHLPNGAVTLYAHDFDSNTTIGLPEGYVPNVERASTINVNYTGFTPAAQAAFQYAIDIWASLITSPVVITVDAQFTGLDPGVLGSAGPNTIHQNFVGAPAANTYYPQALANSLAGFDLSAQADINASFSNTFGFYFGTDGNPGPGEYDFVTVVLHELGHGLGFIGGAYVDAGLGYNDGFGNGPPLIYDLFVQNGGGAGIQSFPNGSVALANELQGNNLFWNGASGTASNGGFNPPMYAPNPWDAGSSYSHLNEASYPAGNANSLMTPAIGATEVIHSPGDVTLGIFEDMGWVLDNGCTLLGCMDSGACNYNPAADCDDGSCTYGTFSWYLPDVLGDGPAVSACTAPAGYSLAPNQACVQTVVDGDPFCLDNSWDSICQDTYCACASGCTDPTACNYDETACSDDGSCFAGTDEWYLPNAVGGGPAVFTCSAPADYSLALNQGCVQSIVDADPFCVVNNWDSICQDAYCACASGCTDATACNYDATACSDDGSCTYPMWYIPSPLNGSPAVSACSAPAGYILADQACAQFVVDNDPFCLDTGWDALCQSTYDCCLNETFGCTDIFACNYDAAACTDDGSCTYLGCTDATACNFDPAAGCDDGSCTYPQWYIPDTVGGPAVFDCVAPAGYILADQACAQSVVDNDPFCVDTSWDGICQETYDCCLNDTFGCTDSIACNYDPSAVCDDGTCTYPGCTYPAACNYNTLAGCDDGSCLFVDECGNCGGTSTAGCTDPAADNYDASAACDDGSCFIAGCTYPDADNYNPNATDDDGSCAFTVNTTCPADLNGDGIVNAGDLLDFLSSFGTICPQ